MEWMDAGDHDRRWDETRSMNHALRLIAATAIVLTGGVTPARAQVSPLMSVEPTALWIHGGVGAGTTDDPPTVALGATYQVGMQVISVRSAGGGYLKDGVWDFGALYGIGTTGERVRVTGEIGAAVVSGKRCTADECVSFPSVGGIPIAVQLRVAPAPFIAVGTYAFANINSEDSFAGVTLSVAIGDVR